MVSSKFTKARQCSFVIQNILIPYSYFSGEDTAVNEESFFSLLFLYWEFVELYP